MSAKIKAGDELPEPEIVPVIIASASHQDHVLIIPLWDESEQDAVGDNPDDFNPP